jgi:glyoxylase-like metal-dependent hydrolase (beta-lactamase superfamily II)
VWLPEHELLFGGCFVKSLNSKTLGFTGDADIAQWPTSMQKLIDKYPTVKQVVPGHGNIGDGKLLTHSKALALKVSTEKRLEK